MNIKERIQKLSQEYYEDIQTIRRHLHKHPELSFQEFNTSGFIIEKLSESGIPFQKGFLKTGILGIIKGKNPANKTIALRADIDALPINEKTNLEFQSVNKGVMHACGHDVHTSVLIGAGKILHQLRDEFEGTVLLIFQPGEEKHPGGAKLLMEEGIFSEYQPETIIGQHVMPAYETGTAGFKTGQYMASADELYLNVKGRGGHAALPGQTDDTVLAASEIILEIKKTIYRENYSNIPTVISFGKVTANGATNVIPDEVNIEGTFRTFDETWRNAAHKIIRLTADSIAKKHHCNGEVKILKGYPSLINNEEITSLSKKYATEYLGDDNIIDMDIRMTADDFSYFSQKYPATYYRLGIKEKGTGKEYGLHTSEFYVDEKSLETGTGLMAWIALSLLNRNE